MDKVRLGSHCMADLVVFAIGEAIQLYIELQICHLLLINKAILAVEMPCWLSVKKFNGFHETRSCDHSLAVKASSNYLIPNVF